MEICENIQLKRFNLLISQIDEAYHEAALKMGLSDSSFHILYILCWYGGECPLSDITTGMSKQTVNSALRKLEADDLIRLKALAGRKKKVCFTKKGEQLAEHTVLSLIKIENEIFDSWTEQDKNFYLALTERYLTCFKEKTKELL